MGVDGLPFVGYLAWQENQRNSRNVTGRIQWTFRKFGKGAYSKQIVLFMTRVARVLYWITWRLFADYSGVSGEGKVFIQMMSDVKGAEKLLIFGELLGLIKSSQHEIYSCPVERTLEEFFSNLSKNTKYDYHTTLLNLQTNPHSAIM